MTVVNVNPLYKPRELESSSRTPAPKPLSCWKISPTSLQAALPQTHVKHVIIASMGDLLGLKGAVVNFVVRHIKKLVPRLRSAGGDGVSADALGAGEPLP